MSSQVRAMLGDCDTLMLDMDGTLLDLAFDNFVWLQLVPAAYARQRAISEARARRELYATMRRLRGTLDWYCLDYWSEILGLDIAALHRDVDHRIGYLPGAEAFLQEVAESDLRLLLVTNSHRTTLEIKNAVTNVTRFFDVIVTSHDLGHAKEDQPFWHQLQEQQEFDLSRTMFIDDNLAVLDSAATFGIRHLVAIEQPDTSAPSQTVDRYHSVHRVAQLAGKD